VTSREFRERLLRRARRAQTAVNTDWIEPLEKYFDLLARWNTKINLTALPLQEPTDETFDRLFIEPLAAARYVANQPDSWCDLGSGGGSPAIPLKLSRPLLKLTMIEAKARKAAFLREAVRILALPNAVVIDKRFDELTEADTRRGSHGLVTVRAVRSDRKLFEVSAKLLRPGGRLFLFRPTDRPISADGFEYPDTAVLMDAPRNYLSMLTRVFHVEQSG
jgi:16S rRNA (guanine527-N7)-methyltransferase